MRSLKTIITILLSVSILTFLYFDDTHASTFQYYLKIGNEYNDIGDTLNAHEAYLNAFPYASTKKEYITVCGSLATTSFALGRQETTKKYLIEILKYDPQNSWALRVLNKLGRGVTASPPSRLDPVFNLEKVYDKRKLE